MGQEQLHSRAVARQVQEVSGQTLIITFPSMSSERKERPDSGRSGDDEDLVFVAVATGAALRFASPRLRAQRRMVCQALRADEAALAWASEVPGRAFASLGA